MLLFLLGNEVKPKARLFVGEQFVVASAHGIFINVFQMSIVILSVSDYVVVRAILPNIFSTFFVAKALECRYKSRHGRVLHRRDRRPRRSDFRRPRRSEQSRRDRRPRRSASRRPRRSVIKHKQHNVNMIWHDDKMVNRNVIVKIIQLADVFVCYFPIWQ